MIQLFKQIVSDLGRVIANRQPQENDVYLMADGNPFYKTIAKVIKVESGWVRYEQMEETPYGEGYAVKEEPIWLFNFYFRFDHYDLPVPQPDDDIPF